MGRCRLFQVQRGHAAILRLGQQLREQAQRGVELLDGAGKARENPDIVGHDRAQIVLGLEQQRRVASHRFGIDKMARFICASASGRYTQR